MSGPDPRLPDYRIVKPLASTAVSRTSQVSLGDRLAVLRQDAAGARRLGLDRGAQAELLRAVSAAGLGPACLGVDIARGLLLTEWLPGQALTAADLGTRDNLEAAARLLGRVHDLPLTSPVVDLGLAIGRYAAAAETGAAAGLVADARNRLAACLAEPPEQPRFCHNDPTPGNFIAGPDGKIRLIDWEYAGLGQPGFDLAGLSAGAGLSPEGVVLLLATYHGRPPTPADLARHRAWEALCLSLAALWQAAAVGPGRTGCSGA